MKILSNKKYDELLLQSGRGMFGAVTDYTLLRGNSFLNDENKRLNNIISELEKWLEEKQKLTCGCGITFEYKYAFEDCLEKLKELKENK